MGIGRIRVALAAIPLLILATAAACAPAKSVEKVLVVDGLQVSLHYSPAQKAEPLVLALHGLGSTGSAFEKYTGLDSFADAHGFVVAYPDAHIAPAVPSSGFGTPPSPSPTPTPSPSAGLAPGSAALRSAGSSVQLPAAALSRQRANLATSFVEAAPRGTTSSLRAWDAGFCCGASTADDVTYLRDVVTAVAAQTKVDLHRVYVIGLSNGGMMALKAICDAPDVFAAAGSVAGPYLGTACARPVWLHLHGASDVVVPFNGGSPPGSAFLGVAKDWCLCSFPNSATEQHRFSPMTIQVDLIKNGQHSWPKVGDGDWNLDGNAALWRFVSHFHL